MSLKDKNICLECGEPFKAKRQKTKFCSKSCRNRNWRRDNPDYNREWLKNHPEYVEKKNAKCRTEAYRLKQREYAKDWYDKHKESAKAYRDQNQDKIMARNVAYRHVEIGGACEYCGSTDNLDRHHPDYSQAEIVVTVCRRCHVAIHGEDILA